MYEKTEHESACGERKRVQNHFKILWECDYLEDVTKNCRIMSKWILHTNF
jgi:hypothetical protein